MKNQIYTSIYLILMIVPLFLGLSYSLLYSLGCIGLVNNGFTVEYWKTVLSQNEFFYSMLYSSYISFISMFLVLVLALYFAWQIFKKNEPKWFYALLFLPLTIPTLTAAFSWFYILSPGGIISRLCYHTGLITKIEDFPRLVNDAYSIGIFVTEVFMVFPLFVLLFSYQIKKEQIADLKAVAITLGSNEKQFFQKIFLPLLLKKTAPFALLYFVFIFGTYEIPILLGRSSNRMISVLITDKMTKFNLMDIPQGHVMALIYSLFVIIVVRFFIQKNKAASW